MKYILNLFIASILVIFSCSDNKNLDSNDEKNMDKIELRTLIQNPYNLYTENVFYVKKESNAYSKTNPKLTFAGHSKMQDVRNFTVNGKNIPEINKGTFNLRISPKEYDRYVLDYYNVSINNENVLISDVDIKLQSIGGTLTNGDIIKWEASTNNIGSTLVVIKQNSISSDGRIIDKPKYEYLITYGDYYQITEDVISRFSDGDEITISVAVANIVAKDNIIIATTALSHSSIFKVKK